MIARSRRVSDHEQPAATPKNIPDNVLKKAIAIEYRECPYCSERQFFSTIFGHNTTQSVEPASKKCGRLMISRIEQKNITGRRDGKRAK